VVSAPFVKGGNAPVEIRGIAKFAKLSEPDMWNKYSCRISPDQPSMAKVHKLISEGIKNKITKDETGEYSIVFSRPVKIKTKDKGEVLLDPVILVYEDGERLSKRFVPDGSDITMKLEIYGGKSPTGFGVYKAARLFKITVHGEKPT